MPDDREERGQHQQVYNVYSQEIDRRTPRVLADTHPFSLQSETGGTAMQSESFMITRLEVKNSSRCCVDVARTALQLIAETRQHERCNPLCRYITSHDIADDELGGAKSAGEKSKSVIRVTCCALIAQRRTSAFRVSIQVDNETDDSLAVVTVLKETYRAVVQLLR